MLTVCKLIKILNRWLIKILNQSHSFTCDCLEGFRFTAFIKNNSTSFNGFTSVLNFSGGTGIWHLIRDDRLISCLIYWHRKVWWLFEISTSPIFSTCLEMCYGHKIIIGLVHPCIIFYKLWDGKWSGSCTCKLCWQFANS